MPEIAVVVLNLNGRAYLADCLNSVRSSNLPADLVVADNGSTDGSLDLVREQFPEAQRLELGQNWGFAEGYNRALAAVPHRWVVLLNNDAALAPDWLEHVLGVVTGESHCAIAGGKLIFSNLPGRVLQSAGARFTDAGSAFEIGWGQTDTGQYDQPAPVASIPGAALLIQRQRFFELGGFDAAYFAYLEDVDLCWRAWLTGYEVRYVPQAVAYHRCGASGGGRASPFRIHWMQRNRLANMVKHLEAASLLSAWPVSLAYDAYRMLEYGRRGHWAALRALWTGRQAFWRDRPALLAERARLQRHRRLSDQTLRARGLLVPTLAAFREYRRLNQLALSW